MAERSHAPPHVKNENTTIVATENIRRTKKVYDVTDWYFEKSDLLETPSILEGMPVEAERRLRKDGARFIMTVGVRMELGHKTTSTGVLYFHRFYMFHTFQDFPHFVAACCCLFLAGKSEETPKKCRDIIAAAKSILTETQFATFGRYPKKEVMTLESILLQTIKFDFVVELPHTFLLKYVKCLKGDRRKLQKIAQMAWNFVNDSLSTVICLEWEPEIVAVALIQLASQCLKFNIVDWTGRQPHHRRWWDLFLGEMTLDVISEICHPVLDLYENPSAMNHNMPKTTEVGGSTPNKNNTQIKQGNAKKSTSEIEQKAASASAALAALTVFTSNVPPPGPHVPQGMWSYSTPESQYFPINTNLNGPPGPHMPPPGPHMPLPGPLVPRGASQMPDGIAGHYQDSSYMRHHHF